MQIYDDTILTVTPCERMATQGYLVNNATVEWRGDDSGWYCVQCDDNRCTHVRVLWLALELQDET